MLLSIRLLKRFSMSPKSDTEGSTKTTSRDKQDIVQTLLSQASAALDLAGNLAPLIPVPFVASIFSSAKVIVDAAAQIKRNRKDCAELAKHVAEVARDVRKEIKGNEQLVDDSLKMALEQLNSDFLEIQSFMIEEARRRLFSRILHRDDIETRVSELITKISDSMQTFKTTSAIRLELKLEKVNRVVNQMDSRLAVIDKRAQGERKWDGQFRLYRRSELDLGPVVTSERRLLLTSAEDKSGEDVEEEISRASIKGRVVAVRSYRGSQMFYQNTLSSLKRTRHINIAQLDGYSEDQYAPFMVLKGDLVPYENYMNTLLTPTERYGLYIRGVMSTLSGHYYLASQGLVWLGRTHDLMIDQSSGSVILGARDDVMADLSRPISSSRRDANTRFLELLPRLIQDWDELRDSAAYLPRSYQPALLESGLYADDNNADPQAAYQVTYTHGSYQNVRDTLLSRILDDPFWVAGERLSAYRTPTPGSVLEFSTTAEYANNDDLSDYEICDSIQKTDMELASCWAPEDKRIRTAMSTSGSPLEPITPWEAIYNLRSEQAKKEVAWSLLIRYGPSIAAQRGVRLRDLALVSTIRQEMWLRGTAAVPNDEESSKDGKGNGENTGSTDSNDEAKDVVQDGTPASEGCTGNEKVNSSAAEIPTTEDSETDTSEDPPIYFHTRQVENDFFDEPWGYFTHESVPLQDGAEIPMETTVDEWDYYKTDSDSDESDESDNSEGKEEASGDGGEEGENKEKENGEKDEENEDEEVVSIGGDDDEDEENKLTLEYSSTIDTIYGITKQQWKMSFVRLHPQQADLLEWIHKTSFSEPPTEYRVQTR